MADKMTAPVDGAAPMDRIIHIADIHFWRMVWNPFHLMSKRFWGNLTVLGRRCREFLLERAEPYADAVAATGAKSVVLTGDFCSTSSPPEFEMAVKFVRGLRDRGLKLFILPGNHDVYTFGSYRARRFERYLKEFLPPQGYPSFLTLPGGTPLILVPTVLPRHFSARGYISPRDVESTARLLNEATDPVVIAGHYPMLSRTRGYASNPFRRLQHAEMLRQALGRAGKSVVYLAGHVHRFSYACDRQYPQLLHLTTGAFLRTQTDTGAEGEFTELLVGSGGFRVVRHVYRGHWEQVAVEPD